MVTLVKHEWHQVDAQFAYELTEKTLAEIYPEMDDVEIVKILEQIEAGEIDIEELLQDAYDNDVEIEWDRQYDDWWTDRKGGYEVTFEVGNESSWVDNTPPPPTHKCTKCKWTGQSYDAEWHWPEDDNEDAKQVCPYCESDIELTPEGLIKEEEQRKHMSEIDAMFDEDEE